MVALKHLAPGRQCRWVVPLARSEARLLGEQAQASTPQQHGVRPEFRADTPCLFCSKHWDKRSAEPPSSPARGNKAKGHQHPPPSPAPSPQVPLCKPLCSSTDHATAPSLALSSPVFGPLCNATGFVVAFPSLLLLIWMSLWLRHWFLLPSENQGFPSTLCGGLFPPKPPGGQRADLPDTFVLSHPSSEDAKPNLLPETTSSPEWKFC